MEHYPIQHQLETPQSSLPILYCQPSLFSFAVQEFDSLDKNAAKHERDIVAGESGEKRPLNRLTATV